MFVEVGSKDGRLAPACELWVRQASEALDAGAHSIVCEGRVSGDAGLYWPDGSIRDELVEALVGAAGLERLIFEAPRRSQQAWLVRHFGPDVGLGNILPHDLIARGEPAPRPALGHARPASTRDVSRPRCC